jgi:hypothetical protein
VLARLYANLLFHLRLLLPWSRLDHTAVNCYALTDDSTAITRILRTTNSETVATKHQPNALGIAWTTKLPIYRRNQ